MFAMYITCMYSLVEEMCVGGGLDMYFGMAIHKCDTTSSWESGSYENFGHVYMPHLYVENNVVLGFLNIYIV